MITAVQSNHYASLGTCVVIANYHRTTPYTHVSYASATRLARAIDNRTNRPGHPHNGTLRPIAKGWHWARVNI